MKRKITFLILLAGLIVVAIGDKSLGSSGYSELIFSNSYTYTNVDVYLFEGNKCLNDVAVQDGNRWIIREGYFSNIWVMNAPRPPQGSAACSTSTDVYVRVYAGIDITALIVIKSGLGSDIVNVYIERFRTPPVGRNLLINIREGSNSHLSDRLWWMFRK